MSRRPPHVKPPAYLSPNVPVPPPQPQPQPQPQRDTKDPLGVDPTRYGDWTLKGVAVDF